MIRKKYRKSANGISVIYRQQGLQGSLFLRMHYPSGFMGKNADKFIYKKNLVVWQKIHCVYREKVSREARKEENFFDRIDRIYKIIQKRYLAKTQR